MKKITIYKDLEHQGNTEIEQTLKNSPEERLAQVVLLIKKIYPLIESRGPKKINFSDEY